MGRIATALGVGTEEIAEITRAIERRQAAAS
jgi:hypothetical protein